jgi:signal transduction histidine kinase
MRINPTPKTGFILFISLSVVLFIQAAWWITFMAILLDEKVDMAAQLGADQAFVENIHQEEVSRQIMLGMEGIFFLVLVLFGAWLIYRALVKTEELKFHQQNFLMAVTHELKTPLASIKIYLDTLQSVKISEEKKATVIPRIKADVGRLEKLVENILDAGRFERSGYHLNKEQFNLTDMVTQGLDKLQTLPIQSRLQINRDLESDISMYGDRKALARAFDAILENSLKYSDKDKIIIDAGLKQKTEKIELVVSDNGIGLSRKETSEIFNRFYRVGHEMTRGKPGSGLGLYLSREIIRAHNGKITAHSNGVGNGTTLIITLKSSQNGNNKNNTAG